MKILHLSTSDSGGGAFRAAFRLHTGLQRLGQDSSMLVLRKGSGDGNVTPLRVGQDFFSRMRRKLRGRRIHADYEKYRPTIPGGVELFSDDRTEFVELVRQLPACDVINLHFVAGFLDHESFFANYPKRVPLVWRMADMGALTGGCHYDQYCGKFAERCGACPQLGSRNANDLSRQIWNRKTRALSRVLPGGLHVVGTSQWIAAEAKRSSLLGRFPVSVIPNGLDTTEFSPRDKKTCRDLWNIPQDASVVLFAAESVTNVRKGFAHLADALSAMSGVKKPFLISVGGGKPELPTDVPHISLGKIAHDRVLSTAYSAADVFVIPSLQESFGQTVIESLACATPVIGFASGGIPDMVRPGISGWLAPTGDTLALRDAIVQALNDPAARAKMSENCRRIAVEEYSLETQAKCYLKLYETLLERARQGNAAVAPAAGAVPVY